MSEEVGAGVMRGRGGKESKGCAVAMGCASKSTDESAHTKPGMRANIRDVVKTTPVYM